MYNCGTGCLFQVDISARAGAGILAKSVEKVSWTLMTSSLSLDPTRYSSGSVSLQRVPSALSLTVRSSSILAIVVSLVRNPRNAEPPARLCGPSMVPGPGRC